MKKSNKEKVLIYAVYSEDNIDYSIKKEEMLKKFCKDNNYSIVEIVRKSLPYRFFETMSNFIEFMKRYTPLYDSIIVYDIEEIVPDNSSFLSLITILKEGNIGLESIRQGKCNYNLLDKDDLLGDDFLFQHYQCSKNKKYFIDTPF